VRALLTTSQVTFVPHNYDDLIVGLADCPQVGGLLELANAGWRLTLKACAQIVVGARRVGRTLLANQWGSSPTRRRQAYIAQGKPVWRLPSINCPEAARLVRDQGFDLIVNARTREIYRPEVLSAPRLGCLNIHHGLLPEQRGLMCDLWALHEQKPAGFSVHMMAPEVDAGPIVVRVEVSDGTDRNFLRYLERATGRELIELQLVLKQIEAQNEIGGQPNQPGPNLRHRRNPTLTDLHAMKNGGLLL
jgi:methionyl-tRNA formyltransferase